MKHAGQAAMLVFMAPSHAEPFVIRELYSSDECINGSLLNTSWEEIVRVCMAPQNFRVEINSQTIVYRYYNASFPSCGGTMMRSEVFETDECVLDSAANDTRYASHSEVRFFSWFASKGTLWCFFTLGSLGSTAMQ